MTEQHLDRRDFLHAGGLAAGTGVLAGLGLFDRRADAATAPLRKAARYKQPNIVFIVVDEMRYPSNLPAGITAASQWLAAYMPNVYELWKNGVKFERHHVAGVACSPSRGAFVTGLYPHQQWMLQTRKGNGGLPAPGLKREFPTYGRILKGAGYATPYAGKWHLTDSPQPSDSAGATQYLQEFGFEGLTVPDIVGVNGDGAQYDGAIAQTAAQWLKGRTAQDGPFCLTASFVNPHDRMYFWGGIYADTFNQLYAQAGLKPVAQYQAVPSEQNPPDYGYADLPPNWESLETLKANKPSAQTYIKQFSELVFGGITDDSTKTGSQDFEMADYGNGADPTLMIARAPYTYWKKGMDSYTQILSMVDAHIGTVVQALPTELADNTVFVMTSDHGDYSGAHGLEMNKMGSAYEEAYNVPLIVADPTGRFTGDTDTIRTQLTSSVDLLPLFANLGYGDQSSERGDLAQIYAERLNLLPLLRSPKAAGREHLVMASDEIVPHVFNFNDAPIYILSLLTPDSKLAVYSRWLLPPAHVDPATIEVEFYDYSAEGGRLEMDNMPHDAEVPGLLNKLLYEYAPQGMQAPLPGIYGSASSAAKKQYDAYFVALNALARSQLTNGNLNVYTDWGDPI